MTGRSNATPSKAKAKQRPASQRRKLSTDAVVEAALHIAERQGFGALSMRNLAAHLGVSATALYHHVASRDALLELCAERAMSKISAAAPEWDWKRRLKHLIVEQQRICLKYPGLSRYLITHRSSSAADMHWMESILDIMRGAGYDKTTAINVMIAMSFVLNPTTLVEEIPQGKKVSMMNTTWANKAVKKNPGKFPRLTEALPLLARFKGGGYFYESQFEATVDRIIAGIARDLEQNV